MAASKIWVLGRGENESSKEKTAEQSREPKSRCEGNESQRLGLEISGVWGLVFGLVRRLGPNPAKRGKQPNGLGQPKEEMLPNQRGRRE